MSCSADALSRADAGDVAPSITPKQHQVPVRRLDLAHFRAMLDIVQDWQRIADERSKDIALVPEMRERQQFADCAAVLDSISLCLNPPDLKSEIYIYQDEQRRPQGIMVISDHVSKKRIFIQCLSTRPDNLRVAVNLGTRDRVAGVGSALIYKAEEVAMSRDRESILVPSKKSAEDFYRKCSFVPVPTSDPDYIPSYMRKMVKRVESAATQLAA